MFHEGDHRVAESSQLVRLASVSFAVVRNLRLPPSLITFRCPETFRAAVPKAAVDEDRDVEFGEQEVWALHQEAQTASRDGAVQTVAFVYQAR